MLGVTTLLTSRLAGAAVGGFFWAGVSFAASAASVTSFGVLVEPTAGELSRARPQLPLPRLAPQINTKYVRLRLQVTAPPEALWRVIFRDAGGRYLYDIDQSAGGCMTSSGCWTERLPPAQLIRAYLESESNEVRVAFPLATIMPSQWDGYFYSVFEGRPFRDLASDFDPDKDLMAKIRALGDGVGMLSTTTLDKTSWCCTGFAISESLFLTNWHCGAEPGTTASVSWSSGEESPSCANGFVDFSWDGDDQNREYQCSAVEFAAEDLDVAILRLDSIAGAGQPPILLQAPLGLSRSRSTEGDGLFVIHHAECGPKKVTIDCQVTDDAFPPWRERVDLGNEIAHDCSTEGGSSGAPVFNENGSVVAIHHLGFEDNDRINKAVPLVDVLSRLAVERPDLLQELRGLQDQ